MSLNHSERNLLLSEKRVREVREAWQRYDLELGIPGIDRQHMWLLAILLDLESLVISQKQANLALSAEDFDRALRRLLGEIVDYGAEHFALEEALLQRMHFPGFSTHRRQHARFLAGVRLRLRELHHQELDGLLNGAEKLLNTLKQWLLHHIMSEDRAYTNHFAKHNPDPDAAAKHCDNILKELGVHTPFEQERLYGMIRVGTAAPVTAEATDGEPTENETPAEERAAIIRVVSRLWHSYRLQLNVPIIDMQHLWLIKMIAGLDRLSQVRASSKARDEQFKAALEEVRLYIDEHFSTEEALMRHFNFPGIGNHARQHRHFVEFINERAGEYRAGNAKALDNLVRDLKDWLVGHIAVEDKRIYYFLKRRMPDVNAYVRDLAHNHRLKIRPGYLELYNEVVRFQPAAEDSGTD